MARDSEKGQWRTISGEDLYRKSYMASLAVLKNVVPFIKEGDDIGVKLDHSAKEVPRLIVAGLHGSVSETKKSHALGEAAILCSESIVMLSFCRDLHGQFINEELCEDLIETYKAIGDEIGSLIAPPVLTEGEKA